MNVLFLALVCLSSNTDPFSLTEVKNAGEAASLPPDVKTLRVFISYPDYQKTLTAVLKHQPNLHNLDLVHPGNGVPLKVLELLAKFPKLENLRFSGDADMNDDAFAALGKLDRLKSLRMHLG